MSVLSVFKQICGIPPADPFEDDTPSKKKSDLADLIENEDRSEAKPEPPEASASDSAPTSPIGVTPPEPAERAIRHQNGPLNALFLAFNVKDCGTLTADEFLLPVAEKFGSWTRGYSEIHLAIENGEVEPMVLFGRYALAAKRAPDSDLESEDIDAMLSMDRMAEEPEQSLIDLLLAELEEFCIAQDHDKDDAPVAVAPTQSFRSKEDFLADCEGLDADGLQFYWEVVAEDLRTLPKPEQAAALSAYMVFRSQVTDAKAIDALFKKH